MSPVGILYGKDVVPLFDKSKLINHAIKYHEICANEVSAQAVQTKTCDKSFPTAINYISASLQFVNVNYSLNSFRNSAVDKETFLFRFWFLF